MRKNEKIGLNWLQHASLQFTLKPKCMCAKRDWTEQLACSNRWLFLIVKFGSFVSLYRPCFNINFSVL